MPSSGKWSLISRTSSIGSNRKYGNDGAIHDLLMLELFLSQYLLTNSQ